MRSRARASRSSAITSQSLLVRGFAPSGLVPRIQTKLTVGDAHDDLEQEADRVAERVMRMPDMPPPEDGAPTGSRGVAASKLQRVCSACDEEEKVQRKGERGVPGGNEAPSIVHEALSAPGKPLDAATRAFMEPRFGHDFSRVRVHDGALASASARAVRAEAYTVGRDVVFREGMFDPSTPAGKRRLAHELAHVAQQLRTRPVVQRRLETDVVLEGPGDDPQAPVPTDDPAKPPGSAPSPPKPAPAKTACLPVVVKPSWDVAPNPILSGKTPCALQFAKASVPAGSAFGKSGMEFKGTVSIPVTCPGTVYFVQYTKPSRRLVGCIGSKELGTCTQPPLGRDGSWPYAFGSQVNTDQNAGTTVPFSTSDTPEQKNISNPDLELVRICIDDSFTTYIVFEDKAGTLTSLGWMSWSFTAHAERDAGTCPVKTTTSDCAGWKVTGSGTKGSSDFTVGAMAAAQKLDRSVGSVITLGKDCATSTCPKGGAAPAPTPDKPGPAPDK